MSQPGTLVFGLGPRYHLVVTCADLETGLTHAKRVALDMGVKVPFGLTTIISEEVPETDEVTTQVWSDVSFEEAVTWALRETYQRDRSVGTVLRS